MGSATKTFSYRYDAARNRTLMIDPEGGRTTYAYDALDRLIGLINPQGERTTYAYDPKGRRTVKELANGTRASFTYDAANRLTTLANLRSDNTVISKFDYKYDNVGNRTEVVEADGSRVTWSYDPTSQLTAEHRTGSVPYRNTFTYDSVGNRLVKNESGARTTYSYDAANQLKTSIDASGITTFTFDANGNQQLVQTSTGDRTTTVWDYENKATLVELPSGIRNTMAYEPDGLRVKLEDSTGTKKFIWEHQNYLAESDENNDINVLYTNEPNYYGNLISQYRKSGAVWAPSYYHYEALGSTRQLTNNTAAITDQYLYDAWGNVINSTGSTINPFQFTGNVGYYFDVDTAIQYIRARIYSPIIGRWLSVDPLGFVNGMSLYVAYFIPRFLDPSGLSPSGWRPRGGIWRPTGSRPPLQPLPVPDDGFLPPVISVPPNLIPARPIPDYPPPDFSVNPRFYNCAGFALRQYILIGTAEQTITTILGMGGVDVECTVRCSPCQEKCWLWQTEQDVHEILIDSFTGKISKGRKLPNKSGPNFHIVCGETGIDGSDPTSCWSKNGPAKIDRLPKPPLDWAPRDVTDAIGYLKGGYYFVDERLVKTSCYCVDIEPRKIPPPFPAEDLGPPVFPDIPLGPNPFPEPPRPFPVPR